MKAVDEVLTNFDNLTHAAIKAKSKYKSNKRIQSRCVIAFGFIHFSDSEIEQMGALFKVLIRQEGGVVHAYKYRKANRGIKYEICFCKYGIRQSVTNNNLEKAKHAFIHKTLSKKYATLNLGDYL